MVREFFKRRYIVCEIVGKNKTETLSLWDKELQKAIESRVQKLYGLFGAGQITNRLKVKYLNSQTKICIIRVPRKEANMVADSVSTIKKVGSNEASFKVLTVSGTLRGCQKWIRTYHSETLPKLIQEATQNVKFDAAEHVNHLQSAIEKTDTKLTELENGNRF